MNQSELVAMLSIEVAELFTKNLKDSVAWGPVLTKVNLTIAQWLLDNNVELKVIK